jgi:hypothetical protein
VLGPLVCWWGRGLLLAVLVRSEGFFGRGPSSGVLAYLCWSGGRPPGLFGLIEVGISSGGTRGLRDRALWATGSDRRARGATGPVPCIPEGG